MPSVCAALPLAAPLVPEVRGLYADGDWVIALFDASATALDGHPYRNTYTWYLRLVDGAIVEAVAPYWEAGFTDIALVQVGDEGQDAFLEHAASPLLEKLRAAAP